MVKEAVKSTNGANEKIGFQGVEPNNTPETVMAQVLTLVQSLGYDGLGVIAVGPRTGQPHNPLDFMPEGWRLQIWPVKNGNV